MKDPTRKYRDFYINNKLEFSYFIKDTDPTTKKEIVDSFLEGKDYQFMAKYCGWRYKFAKASEDLEQFYITVEEKGVSTEEESSTPEG